MIKVHYSIFMIMLSLFSFAQAKKQSGVKRFFPQSFFAAVNDGKEDVVKKMLTRMDTEKRHGEINLGLLLASANYDKDVAEVLIEKGKADINTKDPNGFTPLMMAIRYSAGVDDDDQCEFVCYLLKKGADLGIHDQNGQTPHSFAQLIGSERIAHVLDIHNKKKKAQEGFRVNKNEAVPAA